MVRLFLGGLPPDVTPAELSARFLPFGVVQDCDLPQPKPRLSLEPSAASKPRGFAYLELEPKDNATLQKCLRAFHHSKWRGHVLCVELARPSFLKRLQGEWQLDAEEESKDREEDLGGEFCELEPSGDCVICSTS
jgi:RNA recognition motif-containing protein